MKTLSVVAALVLSFTLVLFLVPTGDVTAERPMALPSHEAAPPPDRRGNSAPMLDLSPPEPAAVPDDQALYLVRSTLLTLENANRTGNYSVLRDVATPEFQRRNSVAELAVIFAALRQHGIDLAPIAIMAPRLSGRAIVDQQGALKLGGQFASGARVISFDLAFRAIDRNWRADAVSVGATPIRPAEAPRAAGP